MSLMAVTYPILPGKTAEWRTWMEELNGPRRQEFSASRQRVGVHERTFLQPSPKGDQVIVTIESDDPGRAFGQLMNATDPFTTWFLERVKAIHGVDLKAASPRPPSQLVADSDRIAATAR